jgi:hypothetical protein
MSGASGGISSQRAHEGTAGAADVLTAMHEEGADVQSMCAQTHLAEQHGHSDTLDNVCKVCNPIIGVLNAVHASAHAACIPCLGYKTGTTSSLLYDLSME